MKRAVRVAREWTSVILLGAAGVLFLVASKLLDGPPGEGK